MEKTLHIRLAVPEDAKTIAAFNQAMANETEETTLPEDVLNKGVKTLLHNPALGFYLVAEKGNQMAGCLMITTEWSDWRNGLFWWIQSVYIAPQFRRQGIYSALYNHVKKLAGQRADVCGFRLYVDRGNNNAQETYRALGMEETRYLLFEELK